MSPRPWHLAPALVQLRTETDSRWPKRDRSSDGTIGDAAHQKAGTSDHLPDARGQVHAIDLDAWDADARDPDDDVAATIAEHLRTRRDARVKYVIWSGRMFSSYPTGGVPAWTWRPYSGPNKHTKHAHVSVVPGPRAADTGPWGLVFAPPRPAPPEDDMTPTEARLLRDVHEAVPKLTAHLVEVERLVRDLHERRAADDAALRPR